MWRVKEFKNIDSMSSDYRKSINIGSQINEFVSSNNIKEYEIVGYTATYAESYGTESVYSLIKYWEDTDNE